MRRPDNVENALKKMKVKEWIEKMWNREQWRLAVALSGSEGSGNHFHH